MIEQSVVVYRVTSLSDTVLAVECSNGRVCVSDNSDTILKFMVSSAQDVPLDAPRVVWNLSELVTALKSVLPGTAVEDLESKSHRADWYTSNHEHCRIYYQISKFLGVHYGGYGQEVTFYELDQFYPEDPPHGTVAEVQHLADDLVAVYHELGVDRIDNLKSPVAVLEATGLLDKYYEGIPTNADVPDASAGILEYAVLCDGRGPWRSAFQVGHWSTGLFECDLGSAYPYSASQLLSLEDCEYIHSKEWQYGACYGFVKGTMHIDPKSRYAFCSPVQAYVNNELIACPTGTFSGIFSISEARFVERHGLGNFELRDGWFMSPRSSVRPMHKVMEELFRERLNATPLKSFNTKRIIDGIIGRLGEYYGDTPTSHTNAIYHAVIRTGTSLRVGEFLIENEVTPVELAYVNTDGCKLARWLPLPDKSYSLGQWRSEGSEPCMVLSPDKVIAGQACIDLSTQMRDNPGSVEYGQVNLAVLSAEQDRVFGEYPITGGDLLDTVYTSEPIEL